MTCAGAGTGHVRHDASPANSNMVLGILPYRIRGNSWKANP